MSIDQQMTGLLLTGPMGVDDSLTAMDDAMGLHEVDDLFGDTVLPPPPPSKALRQRIDHLRTRGCAHSIAWSKQGSIASVARDGSSLDLRFLRCHPQTGLWELTPPTPCAALPPAADGVHIANLAWSTTSTPELAVIDALGRIAILTFTININRPHLTRKWDQDTEDLHPVVGCYWLPLAPNPPNRPFFFMYGPALWNQTEYKFDNDLFPASGPYHPNAPRSALLCVTANANLRLLYYQNNNRLEETSLELESITNSDDIITHASMCSDKGQLIIVMATASRQLKVIRVGIQWSPPQPGDKQAPPGSVTLSPSLKERHLAISTWYQPFPSESPLDPLMTQLSHIEMLPPCPASPSSPDAPPLVLTVRSHIPSGGSLYNQVYQSIIDRWELVGEPQVLHDAFAQLSQKGGQTSQLHPWARLRKLEPIVVPKIVVSIHVMQFSKVLCFAFSDGTVQYRDRFTMNEIYHEQDMNRIMNPLQAGFQYEPETPCLELAFSPTNCSFVQINEDWTARWNKMQYPVEKMGTLQGNEYSATLAALSISVSPGFYHHNSDDVLALARPFTEKKDFVYTWLRSIINMAKVQVDYSEDAHHDPLVRNINLTLCLSIINHLGFRGEFKPRPFWGKFAMLALNLRNIVILTTIAMNTPGNLKEKLSPLDDADVVRTLAGCANWALTLLSWVSNCLLELESNAAFRAILADPKRFSELAGYMQSQNDVSLHLVLCSSSRGFLSAICRRLTNLENVSHKAVQYYELRHGQAKDRQPQQQLPDLYYAYLKMMRATSASLVKVAEFDKLITALGHEIRATYQKALVGVSPKGGAGAGAKPAGGPGQAQGQQDQFVKKAQAHSELDMLLGGNPPSSFREMLDRFFAVNVKAFGAQCDRAKLYFANYDILEVKGGTGGTGKHGGETGPGHVDVFKRTVIKPGAAGTGTAKTAATGGAGAAAAAAGDEAVPQWRRCVRCASVMEEDMVGRGPGFVFVLAQQRKCSCQGGWGLEPMKV